MTKEEIYKKIMLGTPPGKDEDIKITRSKVSWRTISWAALEHLALHHTVGDTKYYPGNWQNCDPEEGVRKYLDALERHLAKIMQGEIFDKDTGSPHIVAVLWNAEVVTHFMIKAGLIEEVSEEMAFSVIERAKKQYGK